MGNRLKTCHVDEREEIDNALKEAKKIVKSRIRRAMKVEGTRALPSSDPKMLGNLLGHRHSPQREKLTYQ